MEDTTVKSESAIPTPTDDQLQLETLDVNAILNNGKKLLGSAGKEYEYHLASMDPTQRLEHQKKSLSARLGLAGEFTDETLIDETDMPRLPPANAKPGPGNLSRINTSVERQDDGISAIDTAATPYDTTAQTPNDEGNLSKRQMNMLKRKNKKEVKTHANKVRIVDISRRKSSYNDNAAPNGAHPMAIKQEDVVAEDGTTDKNGDYFSLERKQADDESKLVSEFKGEPIPIKSELQPETEEEGVEWPFERLCEYLMVDMFDHSWEVRHGAAMGIRDVLRVHGAGAGREPGKSKETNDALNRRWLDDLASRICCVFMLDRFGDYISDNVVAPIRETAGQALGALIQYMPTQSIKAVYRILESLVNQDKLETKQRAWQACHGGMIGMRYLVAVRHDVLLADQGLMDGVLSVVMRGLGDFDDDVRAVSAATLIPVSQEFVSLRPSALGDLVSIVWDCLSNLSDDLSASTGSVMDLLAKLCGYPEVLEVMKSNASQDPERSFANLVPRLFPFLRHTITAVRSAVLRALLSFMDISGEGTSDWVDGKALRLIFQNIVLERNEGVQKLSLRVWTAMLAVLRTDPDKIEVELSLHLHAILNLLLHPIGVSRSPIPMDPSNLVRPSGQVFYLPTYNQAKSPTIEPPLKKRRRSAKLDREGSAPPISAHNIDGPVIHGDIDLVGSHFMIRSKIAAARAVGELMCWWPAGSRHDAFSHRLMPALQSSFSSVQLTSSMVIEEYSQSQPPKDCHAQGYKDTLELLVQTDSTPDYADLVSYLRIVQSQCHALTHIFSTIGHVRPEHLPIIAPKVQGEDSAGSYAFSLKDAERIVTSDFEKLKKSLTPSNRIVALKALNDARSDAQQAIEDAKVAKEQRDVQVKAAAAAAIVAMHEAPKKANSAIKGLMDSIKTEENNDLQKRSAAGVVMLIQLMVLANRRVVVEKLVGNLAKFYCMDTAETPEFHPNAKIEAGIMSLKKDEDIRDHADQAQHDRDAKAAKLRRRGAREALEHLSISYGEGLFTAVPILRTLIESPIKQCFTGELPASLLDAESTLGQEVVDSISVIRALVGKLHADLHSFVVELIPFIITALKCKLSVIRYAAAKCMATICNVIPTQGFTTLVRNVLPSISNANELHQRQGAIECIYHLIHVMEDRILPYVIFLIVPVLGRMSDSDNDIRLLATTAFATLVKLVPLEAGIPDPPGLSEDLLQGRERERKFMAQMLDPKKVEDFEMPVAIKATLRSYQQDGVNWLAFLNRYHLHGILCDDMGLGKTLQTLCIVASDHHMRTEEYAKTQNPYARRLPSLIVCPPTLSGHWQQEIQTYAPFLNAVAYVGPPIERSKVRSKLGSADIVITSYEICRNDADILSPFNWNYCVLDEGHLIKNPAAKTTMAVKKLKSYHRLILSGTPIQNNVLELWSLFDFLMPGFLGTEKVFKDRFARPIAASRFSKSSSKEQEAGALAVEGLHKQVLPFLLRRLKEEVLDDLPPKILQNYYCDLSDLQRKLFEDFNKKEGKALTQMANSNEKEAKQHIFTALNYMRKLCNSPALVMKEGHKQYAATQAYLQARKSSIRDIAHAPKLTALRDLLVDCGIGAADTPGSSITTTSAEERALASSASAVSPHRALIFCQMKEMLDIIQTDVLGRLLPSATYLRLDGSVEPTRRQSIVNTFNSDPSIDILLLTTSVGGLGLNLTGADTVIFVEHDWNPQKDIQAMDRAHRIGQKRVVNVHRLVTRGTLEEKILGLQRFKVDVASQVVKQQKGGLAGMETGEILDLFSMGEGGGEEALAGNKAGKDGVEGAVDEVGEVREKGKKGFLDDLGELWDESQYEEEYNLDEFLGKMKA